MDNLCGFNFAQTKSYNASNNAVVTIETFQQTSPLVFSTQHYKRDDEVNKEDIVGDWHMYSFDVSFGCFLKKNLIHQKYQIEYF